MKQEDKELLLKDLSARLPYGIKVQVEYDAEEFGKTIESDEVTMIDKYGEEILLYHSSEYFNIEDFKPYLRSMSSMTEEEKKEYDSFLFDNLEREDIIGYEDKAFGIDVIMRYRSWEVVQWLLEHHFDFNGLIDVYGLALQAPEGMYNLKEK